MHTLISCFRVEICFRASHLSYAAFCYSPFVLTQAMPGALLANSAKYPLIVVAVRWSRDNITRIENALRSVLVAVASWARDNIRRMVNMWRSFFIDGASTSDYGIATK